MISTVSSIEVYILISTERKTSGTNTERVLEADDEHYVYSMAMKPFGNLAIHAIPRQRLSCLHSWWLSFLSP